MTEQTFREAGRLARSEIQPISDVRGARDFRLLLAENILLGAKLSEYHTGYRAFSREILERLQLKDNSDDFVFDNQMLAQTIFKGFRIGEISCPTRYFPEASSINFRRSVTYGLGVLKTSISFRLARFGFDRGTIFENLF